MRLARIELEPTDPVFSASGIDAAELLCLHLAEELSTRTRGHVRALVAGANADWVDVVGATRADQRWIWWAVPLGVALILMVALRDPASSLNLVATMLLTYLFALGTTHLVFVAGLGAPGIDWTVPYFLFILLVAVGVDYNVFLMARLREESQTYGPREGIVRAIGHTGGLISSAAAITACSFAAFLFSPLGSLRQLGFALVVGIVVDAVLVRSVLVPVRTGSSTAAPDPSGRGIEPGESAGLPSSPAEVTPMIRDVLFGPRPLHVGRMPSRPSLCATRSRARACFLRRASGVVPISAASSAHVRPLVRSLRQPAFVGAELFLSSKQDLTSRRHSAGGRIAAGHIDLGGVADADHPLAVPLGRLPAGLVGQFVPRHGHEEPDEIVGPLQIELAECRPVEETSQDRLADVHRVEEPLEPGVDQLDPHGAPDGGLVFAHQLRRRRLVAGPYTTKQLRKGDWSLMVVVLDCSKHALYGTLGPDSIALPAGDEASKYGSASPPGCAGPSVATYTTLLPYQHHRYFVLITSSSVPSSHGFARFAEVRGQRSHFASCLPLVADDIYYMR